MKQRYQTAFVNTLETVKRAMKLNDLLYILNLGTISP